MEKENYINREARENERNQNKKKIRMWSYFYLNRGQEVSIANKVGLSILFGFYLEMTWNTIALMEETILLLFCCNFIEFQFSVYFIPTTLIQNTESWALQDLQVKHFKTRSLEQLSNGYSYKRIVSGYMQYY